MPRMFTEHPSMCQAPNAEARTKKHSQRASCTRMCWAWLSVAVLMEGGIAAVLDWEKWGSEHLRSLPKAAPCVAELD